MSGFGNRVRRSAKRVLTFLVVLYALWLITIFLLQRSILFPRALVAARYEPPPSRVEVLQTRRPDGVLAEAWLLPATPRGTGGAAAPAPAIVLLHGNAMLAGDWLDWADELAASGVHVLIPEFRGYGMSEGSPAREALVGDATALIELLESDARVDRSRIVVYGRSIGGAIAAEAVASMSAPPAALILHTAPARLRDFSWRFGAPPFFVRDAFDAEAAVTALRGRTAITVIGHDRDEVVPFAHAERLARAAGVPLQTIAGTHNAFGSLAEERRFDAIVADVLRSVRESGARRP